MIKRKGYVVLRYLAALAMAISILTLVLWLLLMNVSTTVDLTRVPLEWFLWQWDFNRCGRLLSLTPDKPGVLFLPALGNSLLVAIGATPTSLLLATPAVFSFSRYPGRDGWLYAGLGVYTMSPMAFVLLLYFILEHFGLLNTHSGLVLVYCSLIVPFLMWMVKNQLGTLPQNIEQVTRFDGLRVWQVLLRTTLPLAKPMLDAAALFGWLLAWDELFYALLFTNNLAAQMLPVTITGFIAGRTTGGGLATAIGILTSVSPLLIVIQLQKSLVSGLTSGGGEG